MKKFISENKLVIAAIVVDIFTIAAIVLFFTLDISVWIPAVLGIAAITLNILAKRKQRKDLKSRNE